MSTSVTPLAIYEKQAEFRQSSAWIRGFCAGRGAGKTRIGAVDIMLRARSGEPFMVVSPNYIMLDETTWPTFREAAEQLGVWRGGVRSPTRRAVIRTQDGGQAEVVFRSGENPESLRGPSKAGLWIDEASLMSQEVFHWATPVLRHRGKMGFLTLTFTPKGRRHWTYDLFFDEAGRPKPDTHLVHAHTRENPFLPPQYHGNIESQYTQTLASQELGGEFIELAGEMFRREWFPVLPAAPATIARVRYWDKAATHGSGAFTAGVRMARTDDGLFVVEDVVRGQWSSLERDRVMLQTAHTDANLSGTPVRIFFEQEGGSGGKESAEQTLRLLAGFSVQRDLVSGRRDRLRAGQRLPGDAKISRAGPLAAQAEAGNVRLLRGRWIDDYLAEICAFPEYPYADQVDASSGAFNKLIALTATSDQPQRIAAPRPQPSRHGVQFRR
ncbi:phage terminase large subunit [Lignipirellula cremea]|uniref:Terminase-like family protein n=1 Tax=Lignipirellula cremea TaxID=2528010 RepID=A0A518E0D5_9BACT|nr:phage terminase large subunit [Lignipirellula cremea]QDU97521.1 Terminase-like family protein [Lignipirellula cremea]